MSSTGSSRGNPSMGDILRSMAVIGVIILALWGFGKFFTSGSDEPVVKTVDFAQVVTQARPAAKFDLLAPKALPKGWRATSARFEPQSWHLGVLTADDEYLGIEQLRVSADRAVDRFAEDSKSAGTAVVDGETWTVRKGPKKYWTYVREADGRSILVNGTTSRAELESYISSLSTS
ncbi:DUF4245 domain-containing protein [Aeromicrobium sp. P5_D10]